MSITATASRPGHVSAWGRRLGEKAIWVWVGPMIVIGLWATGACFAPSEYRVALAVPAAVLGLAWYIVLPMLYYRGWARWAVSGGLLAVLVMGIAMTEGLRWAVLAIFG